MECVRDNSSSSALSMRCKRNESLAFQFIKF
jgi:hypothetical protein